MRLKHKIHTSGAIQTHLLLAVLLEARGEAVHVSGVREDAGHALPQQLVPAELRSSGQMFPLRALLCDPKPPTIQHLVGSPNNKQWKSLPDNYFFFPIDWINKDIQEKLLCVICNFVNKVHTLLRI